MPPPISLGGDNMLNKEVTPEEILTGEVDMAKMSKGELTKFAFRELDLDVKQMTKYSAMKAITKELGLEQLETSEKKNTVKIKIPPDPLEGSSPVFVGYNGTGYLIRRDHEVDVPLGVYDVLVNHAVRTEHVQLEDGTIERRKSPRYPVQRLD